MKKVVFVCSGNYYRSRFAEHYFNWLALQKNLTWQADSRGLRIGYWGNVGPISRHAIEALQCRGIPIHGNHRDPKPLTLADLGECNLIVAAKEAEHRPLMTEQFPAWAEKVEYWHVDDIDCAAPDEAIHSLAAKVRGLVDRLAADVNILQGVSHSRNSAGI